MVNKKFFGTMTLMAAVMLVFSLAACSKNSGASGTVSQQGGNEKPGASTAIRDINTSNWQAVVKENFDLDISLPNGWTVKEATTTNGFSVSVLFAVGGSVKPVDLGETIFNACKAVTKLDIRKPSLSGDDPVITYDSFADANNEWAGSAIWVYYFKDVNGSKTVRLAYSDNEFLLAIT
jgi:hypothetical protein